MGWRITIEGHTLAEDALTAGEWAFAWAAISSVFPHAETDVSPLHCPICRNVLVGLALGEGEDGAARVAGMPRDALLDCVTVDTEPVPVEVPEAPKVEAPPAESVRSYVTERDGKRVVTFSSP